MALDGQLQSTVVKLCELGDLSWLLDEHQLVDYEEFERWNQVRQTRDHMQWVKQIGALYDNMWVDECGRRYGKTVKWLVKDVEAMLRRKGARGMIATPLQKNIGGIIVPLTKVIFKDLPKQYFPRYVGSRGADHEGLVIEATDSYCKLVGLDKHPDATRGQFLDFAHFTEAAFVNELRELIQGVINPQFRYRPWAWLGLETSTAKKPGCDFNAYFRPDAKLRGTYRIHTIRDNTAIPEEEIEIEERRSGGKDSPVCRRELYCEEVRDPVGLVVPEFDAPTADKKLTRHVVEFVRPEYAVAISSADPGVRDLFAMLWGYWDAKRAKLCVERDWAQRNTTTGRVAEVIREIELELYGGASASAREQECYLIRSPKLATVADVISGERQPWNAWQDAPAGYSKIYAPQGFSIHRPTGLTWWNGSEYCANPYYRVSDTAAQLIVDMGEEHKITLCATAKDDKEAALYSLRTAFKDDKIEIHPRCVALIEHLRAAVWNEQRTDYERTEAHGHYDLVDALVYMWRMLGPVRAIDPTPPKVTDPRAALVHHVKRERYADISEMFA